jgi:hypothetical protein
VCLVVSRGSDAFHVGFDRLPFSHFAQLAFVGSDGASIEGTVFINRGEGYQRITSPTQIKAGDFIMASPGGSAQVVYNDECRVKVEAGAVVTIKREPPCWTGSRMNLSGGSLKDAPFPAETCGDCPDFSLGKKVLIGALIVGGVTAAVLLLRDDDDRDRPVTPH